MPTKSRDKRIRKEETSPSWLSLSNNAFVASLLAGLILLVAGTLWGKLDGVEKRQIQTEVEVAKLKQRIADGGTHEIVSQLLKSDTPQSVSAHMSLVKAQVDVAVSAGKPPDQRKIQELVPAVVSATKRFPEVEQSWETISTLASYRTVSLTESSMPLPECDARTTSVQQADPKDFAGSGEDVFNGKYYFHDCRLLLSKLPPGHVTHVHLSGPFPDGTVDKDVATGAHAFAKNVVIQMDESGVSETDIRVLYTLNCRFEFNVHRRPSTVGQGVLLAALESPRAGEAVLSL